MQNEALCPIETSEHRRIGNRFRRIQFTPDLLPTDATGSKIYREQTATFDFQPGPIFGNLVLADEINRARPWRPHRRQTTHFHDSIPRRAREQDPIPGSLSYRVTQPECFPGTLHSVGNAAG
jgi:hypothetical protein